MAKLIALHNKSMSLEKTETAKGGNYKQNPSLFVLLGLEVNYCFSYSLNTTVFSRDPWMTLYYSTRNLQSPPERLS